jgi:hypothetical protein
MVFGGNNRDDGNIEEFKISHEIMAGLVGERAPASV